MLQFADEIELVPFDQPLQIPEGMSPIGRTAASGNNITTPAHTAVSNASNESKLTSAVRDCSAGIRGHLLPLFNPAA
jgi:hypothetical protein